MPNGIPKWIRVYDNNGESYDRYTCVFTGLYNNIGKSARGLHMRNEHHYVSMSGAPYHPQGICYHCAQLGKAIDVDKYGWPPAMGRKGHLGTRVEFKSLPLDCEKVIIGDYKDLWEIK